MTGVFRFADVNIKICSIYPDVQQYCDSYRVNAEADFTVETTQDDIAFERNRSAREDRAEGFSERQYTDRYLELLAVYRKIAEKMPDYQTVLFHGSCVSVDGEAYLFTAKSGTGKSTHTALWRELLGDKAVMVNDDKPLIQIRDGRATAFGTPWDGKHHLSQNISVPLKAICIIQRSLKNSIEQITVPIAYPMLLQQVYRPLDGLALKKTLNLVDELTKSVSLWRLGCNMELTAAEIAYQAMKD